MPAYEYIDHTDVVVVGAGGSGYALLSVWQNKA